MELVGTGNGIMESVLTDGLVSSFHVCDVLDIPKLGHALICWRKSRTKEYTAFGEGDFISINKGTKVVFKLFLTEICLKFQTFQN